MAAFEKRSLFDIYFKMSLDEVREYYRQLRKYQLENNEFEINPELHKILYHVVRVLLFFDSIASKRKVSVLEDNRYTTVDYLSVFKREYNKFSYPYRKVPKVYVISHIGRYDCESAVTAIGEGTNILMSDPGVEYQSVGGLVLRMMGLTHFEHDCKIDRQFAGARENEVLKKGWNILEYPEAGFCLEPVEPVGKFHKGYAMRAIQNKAIIIPVCLEQYEKNGIKDYAVIVGNSILTDNTIMNDADDLNDFVRNEMIKLKKKIWSVRGGAKPTLEEFEKDPQALKKYNDRVNFVMRDSPSYYTCKNIVEEVYKPSELEVQSLKKINKI